ncbi:UNVERIFIED_CONTAM: hypothetical protein Sradi_6797400 [Sesamum radiatum]|uniref:Uncharacterized protein n=1 Tax=Sesamum radiatum TaxID=300843 RepID=A0AAW2JTJ3_SESRA
MGLTIAINYWYDMQFDIKYAYFKFLQSIPHSLSNDLEWCETRNVESSFDRSFNNSGDESDIIVSQADGDTSNSVE